MQPRSINVRVSKELFRIGFLINGVCVEAYVITPDRCLGACFYTLISAFKHTHTHTYTGLTGGKKLMDDDSSV